MIWSILSLFINIPMLLVILGIAAIAAIIYFTLGPVRLIALALDWRIWIAVAAVVVLVALYNSSKTIEAQQQEIATAVVVEQASTDTATVVTRVIRKKQTRQVQAAQEQAVIDAAPVGEELDDLMDEIAREQAADSDPSN